jgi:hypothetical protein
MGGFILTPHFPEYALVFLYFGDPGGKTIKSFVGHLSRGGKGEEEGNVGGVALARSSA